MPKKVCGFGFDCASMLLQSGLEPIECPNYSICGRATRLTPDEEVELIRARQEQQDQQAQRCRVQQQYQYQQEVWRTTRRQLALEMLLRRGCPQTPQQYIPSETFQQLTQAIAQLQQQLTTQFQDSYIPPEGTIAHRYWVHRGYNNYPYNKLMAPSALFAPAQEEQNVRMIHLSRDDDPRNLEARKGITRMQRITAIRSQLQLAQAALDQAIELAEAAIEPYGVDSIEADM
jgi:hypothetical protein